jgi:hypothetical protein
MDTGWLTASELAQKAFTLTTKSAVRFLLTLRNSGVVDVSEQQWIDERFRKRKRLLFRLKKPENKECIDILNSVFGVKKVR